MDCVGNRCQNTVDYSYGYNDIFIIFCKLYFFFPLHILFLFRIFFLCFVLPSSCSSCEWRRSFLALMCERNAAPSNTHRSVESSMGKNRSFPISALHMIHERRWWYMEAAHEASVRKRISTGVSLQKDFRGMYDCRHVRAPLRGGVKYGRSSGHQHHVSAQEIR